MQGSSDDTTARQLMILIRVYSLCGNDHSMCYGQIVLYLSHLCYWPQRKLNQLDSIQEAISTTTTLICIQYQQVTMSIANSTSWAPIGESSLDILNDSVHLIASTVITGMTYGVVLTLYCICAHILLPQVKTVKRRQAVFTFIYISWMFFFCTVYVASNARNTQLAYVNNRNFPGGPAQYTIFIFDQPTTKVGLVAFFAINWMTDAVLVYTLFFLFSRNLLSTARYGVSLFCTKLPVFAMRFSQFPASCSLHLLVCQHNIFLRDRKWCPAPQLWASSLLWSPQKHHSPSGQTLLSSSLLPTIPWRLRSQFSQHPSWFCASSL